MNLQAITQSLEFGPVSGAANLTMYPLLFGDDAPAGYVTLEEALVAGCHCRCRASRPAADHAAPERSPRGAVDQRLVHLLAYAC